MDNSFVKEPVMVVPVGSCKVDQEDRKSQEIFSNQGWNEVLHDNEIFILGKSTMEWEIEEEINSVVKIGPSTRSFSFEEELWMGANSFKHRKSSRIQGEVGQETQTIASESHTRTAEQDEIPEEGQREKRWPSNER